MATLNIKASRPAQPPAIFLRRKPTLKPTGAPGQDRGAAGGGGQVAALDLDKIPPAATARGVRP